MFKRKGKSGKGKLTEDVLVIFERAVIKLPFDLTESQVESLTRAAERITLETTERLVVKGGKSPGLFVTVSGKVESISSTGRIPLRVIKKGDFFGDVSSFFGTPCPVTVRAYQGTELVHIKIQNLLKIIPEKPNVSLFQWFLKRKYIDTSKLFQQQSLSKELAYQSFQETPMFNSWSSDCLHFLVEQILPEIIVLFPTGSYISRQGDDAREIFILVHGAARLSSSKKEMVTVSAGKTSFCMGEEAFFNSLKRNCDIVAETPCLVLIVNKDHLNHLFYSDIPCEHEQELYKALSTQWTDVMERHDKAIYTKHSGQLEYEVISVLLWKSLHQRGLQIPFVAGFFHTLYLAMSAIEVEVGKEILASNELYDMVVVLLKGCGELFSGDQSAGNIQAVGLYLPSSDVPSGSWIKATEISLIIKIPASAIRTAQEQYPDITVLSD